MEWMLITLCWGRGGRKGERERERERERDTLVLSVVCGGIVAVMCE